MNEKLEFRVEDKIICLTKEDETTGMIGIIARFCSLSYEPDRRWGYNGDYARLENGFTVKLIDCEPYTEIADSTKTYCLFAGRHDLPANRGPIIFNEGFDHKKHCVRDKTPLWEELLNEGGKLIVTGHTPSLVEFLIEWTSNIAWLLKDVHENDHKPTPKLTLLHWDSSKEEYWEQEF